MDSNQTNNNSQQNNSNQQPFYYQKPYPPVDFNDPLVNKANGLAIASMILGILSIPMVCCYWIGGVLGILAIVFAIVSKPKSGFKANKMDGMAIAGLVLGILSLVFCVIYLLIVGLGIYTVQTDFHNYEYY